MGRLSGFPVGRVIQLGILKSIGHYNTNMTQKKLTIAEKWVVMLKAQNRVSC
jgi:hypothetical protein